MTTDTSGFHHVTSISSDPQQNVDFYTEVLGLRLVKRTVNFDDKYTYHLYYGDEVGTPGTVLTFFPFEGARQGRVGRGQTSATAFVIPEDSVDYWIDRLESKDVDGPCTRFDETVVPFRDHDGQPLELVTGTSDSEHPSNFSPQRSSSLPHAMQPKIEREQRFTGEVPILVMLQCRG